MISQDLIVRRFEITFSTFAISLVLSSKGGKTCLAVFVERKTRMYFLQKIKDKSAGEMLSATMKVFRDSKEFGPLKVLN